MEDAFQGQTLNCNAEEVKEESENPAMRLIDFLDHLDKNLS